MNLIAVLALAALLQAQEKRPAPDVKDEKYGPHERNLLDLWKAKSESPTPLVVFIHGGGFLRGDKGAVNTMLIRLCLEKGISVASINYRFSKQAPFPAPFHDSARAIQYLRFKAGELNLDPARFAATGSSAGAGMSLWLAFHDDLADPKSEDPVLRQSTRLKGALPLDGQTSYDPRWIREHVGGRAHEHSALPLLYGLQPDELESEKAIKMYEEAAPIRHLTKDDPPVFLSYTGLDKPSDRSGVGIHSEKFGEALKAEMEKLGLSCELKVGPHNVEEQVAFFVKVLKKD